ncbi:MAG: hypothetical protein AAB620_00895 [Patescibacteria group bacterium]
MWDLISKITTVVFGLSTLYLYLENRKLKSFEFEKEANIIEAELEALEWKEICANGPVAKSLASCEIKKKEAELRYYQKMKNYKWIFGK